MKYSTVPSLLSFLTIVAASSNSSSSLLGDLTNYFGEVVEDVRYLFKKPNNYIKAELKVPPAQTSDHLVSYGPGDNCCVFAGASDFWNTLYHTEDPRLVEKIIFCPSALAYLKDLDAGKLAARAANEKLKAILVALMLRRETLIGMYSDSYIHGHFHTCYRALWDKVASTDASKIDHWPCDQSSCAAPAITKNFADFIEANESCKLVLKDQLLAYTQALITAVQDNNLTVSPAVREAIRENLHKVPHLSMPLESLYDTVAEAPRVAVASQIQSVLADIEGILKTQTGSTIYSEAQDTFKQKFAPSNSITDNPEAIKNEIHNSKSQTNNESASKKISDTINTVTKTVEEPTKTI